MPAKARIADRLQESATLKRRNEETVIPLHFIERLGKASDGGSSTVLWDVRGECIRIRMALRESFTAIESNLRIFIIRIEDDVRKRILPILFWRVERNELLLVTSMPIGIKSFLKENARFQISMDSDERKSQPWSSRIAIANAARYL